MRVVVDRRRASAGWAPRCGCRASGHDVVVLEQRASAGRPGLAAARRRLHVGHRPVADHDAVGPGGDVRRRRPRPARRGRRCDGSIPSTASAGRARSGHFDFTSDRERAAGARSRASRPATPAALDGFLAALKPIYEDGILAAGRRPFLRAARLRALRAADRCASARARARCTASSPATSSTRACARRSPSTRCSSAATRSACRRSTAPSSTCSCSTASGTRTAASTRSSRRWRGRSTCAAARAVERIEHAGGRVRGVALRGGERIAADVVVSNADVLRAHELLGRAAPRRRLRPTMSCFLLYLGTRPRASSRCVHHTLLVGRGYRDFIRDVTRGRALPRDLLDLRPRARAHRAGDGGRRAATRCACCCRCRTCAADVDWDERADGVRDALVADLETTFGLTGPRRVVVVEHRMTPRRLRARARRRSTATRSRSSRRCTSRAYFRAAQPRPPRGRPLPRRRRHAPGRRHPRRAARGARSRPGSSPPTSRAPRGRRGAAAR